MPAKSTTKRAAPKRTAHKAAKASESATPTPTPARRKAAPTARTYLFAVGRRKTAIARVRLTKGSHRSVIVNAQPLETYFRHASLQAIVTSPFEVTSNTITGTVSAQVHGGGPHSQAEAIRLGIARVLVVAEADLRPSLKHAGFLTRDRRVKERKKYGLKRARRAPQWQKR